MFKTLQLLFRYILVSIIARRDAPELPYSAVVLRAKILFTLLLPLTVPIIFVKQILRFISNKDLEDAVNGFLPLLTVYQETSEYEYRSSRVIFERIVERANTRVRHRSLKHVSEVLVPPDRILTFFILYENRLFKLTLESRDQFIESCLQQHINEKVAAGEETPSQESIESVRDIAGEEFDDAMIESDGDLLYGFYLGIDIVAAKINIGKKQTPKPHPKLQPAST